MAGALHHCQRHATQDWSASGAYAVAQGHQELSSAMQIGTGPSVLVAAPGHVGPKGREASIFGMADCTSKQHLDAPVHVLQLAVNCSQRGPEPMHLATTQWVFPPPWAFRVLPQKSNRPDPTCDGLAQLVRKSLVKGHYKVATQRCVMLQASGAPVSEDLAYLLTEVLDSLPTNEQRRIQAAAASWALMVKRSPC